MPPKKIIFVTGNPGKLEEARKFFVKNNLGIELVGKKIDMPENQADSVEEVAEFKARSVKDKIEGDFFVEDAGLFIDSLGGFPGVYSHYVYDTLGNRGILKLMRGKRGKKRKAAFRAAIALRIKGKKGTPDKIIVFSGKVKGKIATKPRGKRGFGFDPIFIPDEMPDKTFAQLTREEKNKISHRIRALSKMTDFLKKYYRSG